MKYNEFKEQVMTAAAARGLTEYELYASESEDISTEILHHEVKAFSTSMTGGACFRCILENRIGYASTELYTEEEAVRIVDAAMENALSTESSEGAFIHESGDAYEPVEPVKTTRPDASCLNAFALRIQEAAYAQDKKIADGTESAAQFSRITISLCNSKGLDLIHTREYSIAYCVSIAREGDELYDGSKIIAGDFASLNPEAIGKEAAGDALSRIGADSIETGKYHVVFSNKMTAALLSTFLTVFSAEAAQKGMSLLKGREGEIIAASCVTLTDDPLLKESLIRIPFDSEGVATRRKQIIEAGKLNTLLHNLSTAHKAGTVSTGNGVKSGYASAVSILPYNFYLEKGGAGQKEDIFARIGDGIYITELNGMHAGASPVTGDFSLSAAGFLVEGGRLGRPLKNFTVSGNFYQLLKDIALVGDDLEFHIPKGTTCYGAPSIMVPDMAIAGK